ncbi:flagellar type III secretion system pore protein FliP [Pleionea sp. CnH1-48]|uniref:flagellar type III secretion system pore protein FliP n=1 Tax=Pleionea sp. CnH1-48 TaxID=2954494 RepID=UPI002097EA49|nr:flagellar type III secretion system pore protein FliP [Pleionea sp. CnH1-48]MCO7223702.1 flagellar type III secretion system pore protein FliP [Pleionea sp. CnH1-48]
MSIDTTQKIAGELAQQVSLAEPLEILIFLTALSVAPLLLVAVTSFTRFIIVFSMLRFALGLQQTPPNIILISISLFLTLFVMQEPLTKIHDEAVTPYMEKSLSSVEAIENAKDTMTRFMIQQTREEDLALIVRLAKESMPDTIEQVKFFHIVPAFLLSELRMAFKIGFVIFLPFLLVDLVVSSVLMSLGMIMLPPTTISLPIKIMLFVLIDGWNLIVQSLVASVSG